MRGSSARMTMRGNALGRLHPDRCGGADRAQCHATRADRNLGTVGATHVRFLFGFPFALLFLVGVLIATGEALPSPPNVFWLWVIAGAFTQIAATATMLSVMGQRSFVVAYAYIKTEPVHVALFGLVFLGDKITPLSAAAILLATAGVIVISLKGGIDERPTLRSTAIGIVSGALFGLSAIGYRGAILALHLSDFVVAATFTVAVGLVIQAAVLSLYLALWDAKVLHAIAAAWRPSLFAGFMGAFASEFWFLAFAITTAANVRTLALVEVLFAQGVTRFVFKTNHAARGSRHRACCDWCCATGVVALVPLVRQYRQGMEFDAFLGQLFCFLRRSDAVDRAMLYLSIVHLARFLWKFWADIVRVFVRWSRNSLSLERNSCSCGDNIATGADGTGAVGSAAGAGASTGARCFFTVAERRGAMIAFSTLTEPHWASSQAPASPACRRRLNPEQAFKFMARWRRRARSGSFGSPHDMKMGRFRHRLSDFKAPAVLQRWDARSRIGHFRGIDLAMTIPGSVPASAMMRPQGSTISEWPYVSRPFSCLPPCAAAKTKQPFSMARARIRTCQCASPVCLVNAEGIASMVAPASASAR